MKLINEKEVEEAAENRLQVGCVNNNLIKEAFVSGSSFAEQKLLSAMVEFGEYVSEYERNRTFCQPSVASNAITQQLLEKFLETKNKTNES